MMPDSIDTLGHSTIQHGNGSDRVYLMELNDNDMPDLLPEINELAERENYGKIFAKVPAGWAETFTDDGFRTEALVPDFFRDQEDGHFMGKYLDPSRAEDPRQEEIDRILALANAASVRRSNAAADDYTVRRCTLDDCEVMAERYDDIFVSYPFPVNDPDFLAETMEDHVAYFGAWQGEELAALASAEQYCRAGHVEMTDFLTMPEHRRQGLAGHLLATMEHELRSLGLTVAYTIARALSPGMNITFARADYHHGGTLINNTQICGRIESMQVWYKDLR
ncbi:MAG: putative beta-lysine N-acetyltransferase [Desulfobulbaceae bacterium]|nr:putative beta-lysine N-acetyltransferase [Desulfobulbaceae bacterium]